MSLYSLATLIQILSNIIISIFLLRFFLQLCNASYANPICAILYKATQPIVGIFAKFFKKTSRIDWALLICIFIIAIILQIIQLKILPIPFSIIKSLMLAVVFIIDNTLNVIFFATIIAVIASWVKAPENNALVNVAYTITKPILKVFAKVILPQGKFDFGPFILLILIKTIQWLVLNSLIIRIWSL